MDYDCMADIVSMLAGGLVFLVFAYFQMRKPRKR